MEMEGLSHHHVTLKLLLSHVLCISSALSLAPRMLGHQTENVTNQSFGFRANLWRRDNQSSFTHRFHAAVERSKQRAQNIAAVIERASADDESLIESPVVKERGEFLMAVGLGTPTVNFMALVDTGSDLIWTQCLPCQNCFSQSTPIFDPSKSSTYSTISYGDSLCTELGTAQTDCDPACSFKYRYGSGAFTSGGLAYDTMSIGSGNGAIIPHVGFGCGHDNEGFSRGGGFVGLGRGTLSLIAQLASMVDNKFSYCLLPFSAPSSKSSPLIFGDGASFTGGQTLTLITNAQHPTFWYVPVTGLTVGGKAVDIPSGSFDIAADGSGGMIIDSGTTLTFLVNRAYNPLRDAVQSAVSLPTVDASSSGLDLCFDTSGSSNVQMPSMVFNFGSVGLEVPPENIFVRVAEQTLCLAMLPSRGISIFGNIQQQNVQFLYNNAESTLSFKSTKCDSV